MVDLARILTIDEDKEHSQQLAVRLQGKGHQAVLCAKRQNAVAILKSCDVPFELIVLNLSNAQRQGLECLREVTRSLEDINHSPWPLILCTSADYFEPEFEVEVEGCGARVVYER